MTREKNANRSQIGRTDKELTTEMSTKAQVDPDVYWAREAAADERFGGTFALPNKTVIARRMQVLLEARAVEAERCAQWRCEWCCLNKPRIKNLKEEFMHGPCLCFAQTENRRAAELRRKAKEPSA